MSKTVEKGRSAKTGQFVPIEYAQKHPDTTVVEKVKVGPTKHRKYGAQNETYIED